MASVLESIDRKLRDQETRREIHRETLAMHRRRLDELGEELTAQETALALTIEVAKKIQTQVHQRVSGLVSQCLRTVFDEPYEFQIQFERKRGKTEARMVFIRDGMEVDPMTAAGGGVVDVASFGLRLACLVLRQPANRKVLVLDEPFRFVSSEYRDRIGKLLEDLSNELEVQIIMVTHITELERGTVITV